jgi:23S rRNA (guanosine2251-2'-O)-methyltransferase
VSRGSRSSAEGAASRGPRRPAQSGAAGRAPRSAAQGAPSRGPRGPGQGGPSTILYGRNPVHEALRAGRRRIETVWATERAAREPWLREVPAVRIVTADELTRRCGSPDHQGVCAEAGGYPYVGAQELLATKDPFIVALDELQDPQNLGAICRTAECAGATGVVLCERRAAAVTPAAAKASAGAVEHLRIARVRNMADFLADAKAAACWCYGADGASLTSYDEPDYSGGVVLVLGGEGSGLRPRVAQGCDALISLPQHGRVQSLNASAAAAVLMYGIVQRRPSA